MDQPTDHRVSGGFSSVLGSSVRGFSDGDEEALNQCRNYLLLIANREFDQRLRAKLSPSDVVQESLALAYERSIQFRGTTRAEFMGWLRMILLNQLATARRRYLQTGQRNVMRELLDAHKDDSSPGPTEFLVDSKTPSRHAMSKEWATELEFALSQLPDDDRLVIQLRNWDRLSFAEIAQVIGRSPEATRKVWVRAVDYLGELVDASH